MSFILLADVLLLCSDCPGTGLRFSGFPIDSLVGEGLPPASGAGLWGHQRYPRCPTAVPRTAVHSDTHRHGTHGNAPLRSVKARNNFLLRRSALRARPAHLRHINLCGLRVGNASLKFTPRSLVSTGLRPLPRPYRCHPPLLLPRIHVQDLRQRRRPDRRAANSPLSVPPPKRAGKGSLSRMCALASALVGAASVSHALRPCEHAIRFGCGAEPRGL